MKKIEAINENNLIQTNNFLKDWKGIIEKANNTDVVGEVINTGSIQLNKALGINGFPVGRIIEIFGNESSGKTTIALQAIKEAQNANKKCLFIDAEHSLDMNYVKSLGIDINNLLVANPLCGEQAFEIMEYMIKNKLSNFIVVDSVAALIPKLELENNINDHQLGAHARLMSKGLRKIQALMNQHEVTVIFLNQIREKIGVFFGNPETTTGGKALKFFSSIRIEVRKNDLIKDNNNKIGIRSKITIVKNKLSAPFKIAYIDIYFNTGYDNMLEILEFAIDYGILIKNGSWYFYNNNKICQGKEQLKKFMLENVEFFNTIKEETIKKIDSYGI